MGSNASDVARKNCGFWCFLGVTEMGGVCDLSLWTVPQWKPKWCWDRHSNRHGDDFWLEYGGFLGSRCFFSLLSWENPRWWDKKRTKKRKSNDHIWDIYGYISAVQLYQALKKGSQLTTLTCCADVAAVGLHVQKWGWLDPSNGARITACLAKVSRTWMVAMANLLTKKWMT